MDVILRQDMDVVIILYITGLPRISMIRHWFLFREGRYIYGDIAQLGEHLLDV